MWRLKLPPNASLKYQANATAASFCIKVTFDRAVSDVYVLVHVLKCLQDSMNIIVRTNAQWKSTQARMSRRHMAPRRFIGACVDLP